MVNHPPPRVGVEATKSSFYFQGCETRVQECSTMKPNVRLMFHHIIILINNSMIFYGNRLPAVTGLWTLDLDRSAYNLRDKIEFKIRTGIMDCLISIQQLRYANCVNEWNRWPQGMVYRWMSTLYNAIVV